MIRMAAPSTRVESVALGCLHKHRKEPGSISDLPRPPRFFRGVGFAESVAAKEIPGAREHSPRGTPLHVGQTGRSRIPAHLRIGVARRRPKTETEKPVSER